MQYSNLSIGSRGDEVRNLQSTLGITADGIYGPQTAAAVKSYQESKGLKADSIAGPITQGSLYGTGGQYGVTNANAPITSGTFVNMMNGASPSTLASANQNLPSSRDFADVYANVQTTGADYSIANSERQYQRILESEKQAEQEKVNLLEGELARNVDSTKYSDVLESGRNKYNIDEYVQLLNENNAQIAAAKDALNQGLIAEQGRPVRAQVLSGAMAVLTNQANARIGALTAISQVLQGNIELGEAQIDQTMDALKADDERSLNALNTLLEMADKKLTKLTDAERDSVERQIKTTQSRISSISNNKDKLKTLITSYGSAAQKAGVTLTDTYETALSKMKPFLSASEYSSLVGDSQFMIASELVKQYPDATTDELKVLLQSRTTLNQSEINAIIASGGNIPGVESSEESGGGFIGYLESNYTDDILVSAARNLGLVNSFNLRSREFKKKKVIEYLERGAAALADEGAGVEEINAWIEDQLL